MEVEESGSETEKDLDPCQEDAIVAMVMDVEAAVGDELVDEEELVAAAMDQPTSCTKFRWRTQLITLISDLYMCVSVSQFGHSVCELRIF